MGALTFFVRVCQRSIFYDMIVLFSYAVLSAIYIYNIYNIYKVGNLAVILYISLEKIYFLKIFTNRKQFHKYTFKKVITIY